MKFKTTNVPRQQGERARVKVVRGPDYGSVFVITGARATVGRGEDNDIVISDLKASRHHVEIAQGPQGWAVRDLGSANGILVNGKAAASGNLRAKDTVTVGETLLEFVGAEQATVMLVSPPRTPEQIQAEQGALEEQQRKVKAISTVGGLGKLAGMAGQKGSASPASGDQKRKLLLFGAAGLAALMLFGGNDQKKPQQQPKNGANSKGSEAERAQLEQYLPSAEVPAVLKSAEMFFKTGFREYSQGNYLRAKNQFETVLQMSPGHPLATLYLQNSENKIKDLVRFHIENGRKSFEAGKLKEARGHYEAIMRLLFRDQTHPAYIEAKDQLQKVLQESRTSSEGLS